MALLSICGKLSFKLMIFTYNSNTMWIKCYMKILSYTTSVELHSVVNATCWCNDLYKQEYKTNYLARILTQPNKSEKQ